VFSGTTDVNGQVNGGAGVELIRATLTVPGNVTTLFAHRLIIEGRNTAGLAFQAINATIEMRGRCDMDFPMEVLRSDYESELGEA
jgi:hypothetical protein